MSRRIYAVAALFLGAAGTAGVAFAVSDVPTQTSLASPPAETAGELVGAFREPADASDKPPHGVEEGALQMTGGVVTTSRRALVTRDLTVFAAKTATNWYCVAVHSISTASGSVSCNDYDSLTKGYVFSANLNGVAGLVPDGVRRVDILNGEGTVLDTVAVTDNAYASGITMKRFGGVRLQSVDGTTVEFLRPALPVP